MHEPLKHRTYLGKKLFFNFFGADFFAPKSSQRREKQPALGLALRITPKIMENPEGGNKSRNNKLNCHEFIHFISDQKGP